MPLDYDRGSWEIAEDSCHFFECRATVGTDHGRIDREQHARVEAHEKNVVGDALDRGAGNSSEAFLLAVHIVSDAGTNSGSDGGPRQNLVRFALAL